MAVRAGQGVVDRAHEAASSGGWQQAVDLFSEADADDLLAAADLPLLAEVAYAAGQLDLTIEAWERAYAACMQAGDPAAAAGAAVRLAMHLLFDTALMAPVRGWLARAERLLDVDGETPATPGRGRPHLRADADRRHRRRAAVGSASDRDRYEVRSGGVRHRPGGGGAAAHPGRRRREGLALLDEAGVATVSGDLDPLSTGVVYCELVCALQGLAHYDVAEEWTEAMERWCETNAIGSLHGRCRVHRAEILRLRGSCNEAESQALDRVRGAAPLPATRARLAPERARTDPAPQGRHRRRRGCPARRAPRRVGPAAGSRARAARPRRRGRRRRLDPGRPRAPAAGAVEGATTEHRSAAGAAARGAVEIEIAVGDFDRARSAADELERHRRPLREHRAGRRRGSGSRTGAARGGRRRRARSSRCPRRSGCGTTSARPTRRRSRAAVSRRCPRRQRQRAPGRAGAASGARDPRRDRGRAVDGPRSTWARRRS